MDDQIFLNENSGVLAVFSSTGGNFAQTNLEFNQKILEKFTHKKLQVILRFSDLVPHYSSSSNDAKWILLGDSALKINFPEFEVITTKLNDISIENFTGTVSPGSTMGNMIFEDTLKNWERLSKIELKGLSAGMYILHVQNELGSRNFRVLKQ